MNGEKRRSGGCLCGAVRFEVRGEPYQVGLCHCADCRKVTGSLFLAYGDWRPEQFTSQGNTASYAGRSFCPLCGSRLFSRSADQVEIYLGTLDEAPNDIQPTVEGWSHRREIWMPPFNTETFAGDPA